MRIPGGHNLDTSNPTIVSEAEINPNLYFNASNLKDGVKERTDMTEVDDYLMNKAGIQGPSEDRSARIDLRFSKSVLDFSIFRSCSETDRFGSVHP